MDLSRELDALVDRAGIVRAWHDIDGRRQETSIETMRALLAAMRLDPDRPGETLDALDAAIPNGLSPIAANFVDEPLTVPLRLPADVRAESCTLTAIDAAGCMQRVQVDLAAARHSDARDRIGRLVLTLDWPFPPVPGEYRLRLEVDGLVSQGRHLIAPARCWEPGSMLRGAGLSAQIYALRDRRERAIGDLESLARLGEWFGRHRGQVVLANPLGGPVDPRAPSLEPYSPSSRLTIDPIYLPNVRAIRDQDAGDRIGDVAAIRSAALDTLAEEHAGLLRDPDSPLAREFRAWSEAESDWLEPHAIFAARIRLLIASGERVPCWERWAPDWRSPDSAAVARWKAAAGTAIDCERYAIWRLERAATDADRRGREAGLALGLGHDLPLGCARHGAETWSQPEAFALEASLGAPPDPFCRDGQDWGLPPLRPHGLAMRECLPWRSPLRAAMRRGGLVRVDHVMGIDRLWWIPPGGRPADGAYVRYPSALLLPLLVHDSHAYRCLVVGEDLGTVDPALRQRLAVHGVLSTRVLRFERDDDGSFRSPERYPERAWVTVGTHDLPGAVAHRRAADLDPAAFPEARAQRAAELDAMVTALRAASIDPGPPEHDEAWLAALHRFLAVTPAMLIGVQVEDLLGHAGQVNVPGTVGPRNWSHRLARAIEDWDEVPSVRAVLDALSARLGRGKADRSGGG